MCWSNSVISFFYAYYDVNINIKKIYIFIIFLYRDTLTINKFKKNNVYLINSYLIKKIINNFIFFKS